MRIVLISGYSETHSRFKPTLYSKEAENFETWQFHIL